MTGRIPDFPILDVSTWPGVNDEPMGTKPKYWLREVDGDAKWLFKQKSRPNSDDDWSEKIASELAPLLGIPHARVELARRHGQRGIISADLVSDCAADELVPGNRLLLELDPGYPVGQIYHVAHHTMDRIFAAIAAAGLPPGCPPVPEILDASDLFVGYLLFDAWIGNTDRHHENWAVITFAEGRFSLAPSYDHAASLGHNLLDANRSTRLTTKDKNQQVVTFAAKARSAVYRTEIDLAPVSTDDAFILAVARRPAAGRYWFDRLPGIRDDDATEIVRRIPGEIMSDHAKRFAVELLRANRTRLSKYLR